MNSPRLIEGFVVNDGLIAISRRADAIMLLTLLGSAAAALAIGDHFGSFVVALVSAAALIGAGTIAYVASSGSLVRSGIITLCNVAMVALHIQLGRGTIEFHFGVFALLGLLLAYRNWQPIALAAAAFAVHHLVFDRLQAFGWRVYCTPSPDLLKVVMHAAYLVVQTGVEIYIGASLARASQESIELSSLLGGVSSSGRLRLNTAGKGVNSPNAIAVKRTLDSMAKAIASVSLAADSIKSAGADIAAGNVDLSDRTNRQAADIQRTAASTKQLAATASAGTATAKLANDLAASALVAASDGGKLVGQVADTMAEISDASKRIADIIGLIDSIAFQTNILALNAAVEAARAGDRGRGFAVVATEVRALAGKSSVAALEIKRLIDSSVTKVDTGARQVRLALGSTDALVGQVRRVSEMMSDLANTSNEQCEGIGQIDRSVANLDALTRRNAALVIEGAAATASLNTQAHALSDVVKGFSVVVS